MENQINDLDPEEAYSMLAVCRKELFDLMGDISHMIDAIPEDMYYYGRIAWLLDHTLSALRTAYDLSDEGITEFVGYFRSLGE